MFSAYEIFLVASLFSLCLLTQSVYLKHDLISRYPSNIGQNEEGKIEYREQMLRVNLCCSCGFVPFADETSGAALNEIQGR